MQQKDAPENDDLLLGTHIELLSKFDMNHEENTKKLRCYGIAIERVCDNSRLIIGIQKNTYKVEEAVDIFGMLD